MDKFLLLYKCRNCGGRVTQWAGRNPTLSIPEHLVRIGVNEPLAAHKCSTNKHGVGVAEYGVADLIGALEE